MAAPIKHTCPEIDKYIKSIKYQIHRQRDFDNMSEGDIQDVVRNMNDELENCIEYLESLRNSNHTLREWGEDLESKLNNAESSIYELEEQLKSLL